MPREYTNLLIDYAKSGLVSWEDIARECVVNRMSEDEVKDMSIEMGWIDE